MRAGVLFGVSFMLSVDQLRSIYRQADLFVAPAFLESFGIAALEARCAGLPVLAMRGTGITEFVADRREGLLADGDAGMTKALVEIATNTELRRHGWSRCAARSVDGAIAELHSHGSSFRDHER